MKMATWIGNQKSEKLNFPLPFPYKHKWYQLPNLGHMAVCADDNDCMTSMQKQAKWGGLWGSQLLFKQKYLLISSHLPQTYGKVNGLLLQRLPQHEQLFAMYFETAARVFDWQLLNWIPHLGSLFVSVCRTVGMCSLNGMTVQHWLGMHSASGICIATKLR